MSEDLSFSIPTSAPLERSAELLEQIRRYHLMLHPERFRNVRRGTKGASNAVTFTLLDANGQGIGAELWVQGDLHAWVGPGEGAREAAEWLYADLTRIVEAIEIDLEGDITLIWVKGEQIIPEEMPSTAKRMVGRLFSRTLLLLNVVLFAFNIILFFIFGIGAVVAILVVQLLLIVFADRLFGLMGKWSITSESPEVFLLNIRVSSEVAELIKAKKVDLVGLKQAVFESSFAHGQEPSCSAIADTLLRFGVLCSEDGIKVRVVNVLELVKRAAYPFNTPLPKIVISNSMVSNAAASGISFRRGVILLTGGILTQLSDDELVSVIGHELGHLKGRDPLYLFAIVSGEFLLRVTLLFSLFLASPLLYLFIATFLIFFIAKFFEARADLLSVMAVGQPKVLADSLRKIGFQRLQVEKASKLGSWLRFDPHPPLYFRIERLEGMTTPVVVEHPLLQSAKDVINGFRAAFSA